MVKLKAMVEDIKKGFTRDKNKPYWKVFLDSGDVLIAWSFGVIGDVQIGNEATFVVEKSGDFLHIKNASVEESIDVLKEGLEDEEVPLEDVKEPAIKKPIRSTYPKKAIGGTRSGYSEKTEMRIMKQNAVSNACEYVKSLPDATEPEEVINIAKMFMEYYLEEE